MLNILTPDQKEKMYLDYFNNFLSVERFAEHYGICEILATDIIMQGRRENYKKSITIQTDGKHDSSTF